MRKWLLFLFLVVMGALASQVFWEGCDMAKGLPDWKRGITLMGQDPDGDLILIRVDADGRLEVPFKGVNPSSELVTVAVDSDGQLYTIVKGTDGNVLAVDSDGYMTAVLKGAYNSTLKTLAVDSDGRIFGYQVDDLDQWGQTLLVGNAEQAARLGSPVSWDRRGQVQAVFDFANGFHGVRRVTAGAGAAIALDSEHWQFGGYSVKLTGGSDSTRWAYVAADLAVPPSDTLGCAINFSAELTPQEVRIVLGEVVDHTLYYGRLRYYFTDEKLQYYTSGAAWADVASKDLEVANYAFHRMKLVIDVDSETYVRAMLNNSQYDMTASILTSNAPTVGDYAFCEVYCISDVDDNDVVYLDSIIFTVEE